jgi:hypothetical protein
MSKSLEPLQDTTWQTRHEWVLCLRGDDAQTLAWQLCEWIDDPAISKEGLQARVNVWWKNAQKSLGAQAWTVRIDPRLGVCLDPWLYLFDKRRRGWNGE